MNAIATSAAHIASHAMLVDFSVSKWTARKIDKAASAELTDANRTNVKLAHVSKKLVVSDTLTEIDNVVMQARLFHMRHTSPWFDNGSRILSVALFDTYTVGMEAYEAKFYPLVARFVAEYPEIREYAAKEHVALGRLFNHADYPQASRIAAKFAWRQKTAPIPRSDDFRVNISESAAKRIKADIEATAIDRANNAVIDCFERVRETVSTMVEKLDAFRPDASGKDRGTFRDTLVTNVRDLVSILPGLNFTGDARVSQLVADMTAIVAHEAEDLRADDTIRRDITAKAKAIVESVSDFMA